MTVNLVILMTHECERFELFLISLQAELHVLLDVIHLFFQVIAMFYQLVDVEILSVAAKPSQESHNTHYLIA